MIWTAFAIGLMGSLHCVGMCGPIAFALPIGKNNRFQRLTNAFLYHVGRILTYTLLGLIIGLFGKGIFLAGMQKHFSILTGIMLIVMALFSFNLENKISALSSFNTLFLYVKSSLGRFLGNPSRTSIFFIGLTNGLLPCGLVYLALVSALTLGSLEQSFWYMFFFGLGTVPLMLVATLAGNLVNRSIKNRIQQLQPALLIALASWLIYRGTQFSLPANFNFWEAMQNIPMCH